MNIVFAGPSLCRAARGEWAGVEFCPPAGCGDVLRAMREGASRIGLIDGVFETRASVWHKEILAALANGVEILGASSMGALRAAECHIFGMRGIGRIYEAYRSGSQTADSDVAILHAPAELGFTPLTLALVDADATIERMHIEGALSRLEASLMKAEAARLHFKERTWSKICEVLPLKDREQLAGKLKVYSFSQKHLDAMELLKCISEQSLPPAPVPSITAHELSRTLFLENLELRAASAAKQ